MRVVETALRFGGRHPALVVFAVAFAARVVVAVTVWVLFGGTLFPDDMTYSALAADAAAGATADWSAVDLTLYRYVAAFLLPLTLVYELFGPVEILGQLLVALAGAATAALTTRVALEAMSARWASVAGLVVAFFPSQVLWSSLIIKDAFVWAALTGLAVVVAVAGRSVSSRLVAAGVVAAGLLVALAFLRPHTLVIAAWALALASLAGQRRGRPARVSGALGLAIAVPWLLGLGPAGYDLVLHGVGTLEERREANATGETAIEDPDIASLRHLPRGLAVMLLRPYPAEALSSRELQLALAEHLVWYPLLVLALIGTVVSLRGSPRVAAFPLLAGAAIVLTYALTEGNIGTAYRHRSEFLWAVALAATFGLRWLVQRRGEAAGA